MSAPARFDTRDIARIAVFAAIIAALGLMGPIPIPGLAVPVTAQTLGVILAGTVLGPRRGAAAVAVLLLLVAIGLPLLSGGRGGAGVFAGPTAGYLIGWVAGAFVTGLIAHSGRGPLSWWRVALGALVGGVLVVYLFGIPVQTAVLGIDLSQSVIATTAFLPGDLIKVVLATILTLALWKAYPPVFGARRARATSTVRVTSKDADTR
ncbi:biotin transporter BioY [Salinibacterium sp. ZJ70]|uniref:biotin transporter BioY n=1 Tax=Salinibacterium sp. ZJ70 TaxID=2708084 RepID=UPI001423E6C4|nr:biotin transporter BioY [Salinibacterium sp. ZJ70]